MNPNVPEFIPADVRLLQNFHASEPDMVAAAVQESLEGAGREDEDRQSWKDWSPAALED